MAERQAVRMSARRVGRFLAGLALAGVVLVGVASPFAFILLPGLIGGVLVAALIRFGHWHHLDVGGAFDGLGNTTPPMAINFSSIQVSGAGGLTLVFLAVAIGIAMPRAGQTLLLGLAGGTGLAIAKIAYRRRHGGPGAGMHTRAERAILRPDEQAGTPPSALDSQVPTELIVGARVPA